MAAVHFVQLLVCNVQPVYPFVCYATWALEYQVTVVHLALLLVCSVQLVCQLVFFVVMGMEFLEVVVPLVWRLVCYVRLTLIHAQLVTHLMESVPLQPAYHALTLIAIYAH